MDILTCICKVIVEGGHVVWPRVNDGKFFRVPKKGIFCDVQRKKNKLSNFGGDLSEWFENIMSWKSSWSISRFVHFLL